MIRGKQEEMIDLDMFLNAENNDILIPFPYLKAMQSNQSNTLDLVKETPPTYKDLPSYAGITEVDALGIPVDECSRYLVRLAAIKRQMVTICSIHMLNTPEWETKAIFARWLWEDANLFRDFEKRTLELRSSRAAISKVLQYQLGDFLTELLHSPSPLVILTGLFDVLTPALCQAYRDYIERSQNLVDWPSIHLLKSALDMEEKRQKMGMHFLGAYTSSEVNQEIRSDWKNHFSLFLKKAGGVLGMEPLKEIQLKPRACEEIRLKRELARDERFTTVVPKTNPPGMEDDSVELKMWHRSQEMPAAELVASVIIEWEDLPTEALVDLSRHCWDEVRHALFGQVALEKEGFTFTDIPNWIGFGNHTLPLTPQQRFSHLAIAIEAKMMRYPGGKRGEWEFCRDVAKHPLMTTFQDFDWADEVNHVNYGRKWLVDYYFKGNRMKANEMADESMEIRLNYYSQYEAEHSR